MIMKYFMICTSVDGTNSKLSGVKNLGFLSVNSIITKKQINRYCNIEFC
jgi:hypothetical protein